MRRGGATQQKERARHDFPAYRSPALVFPPELLRLPFSGTFRQRLDLSRWMGLASDADVLEGFKHVRSAIVAATRRIPLARR
jgi:hypothetical protein